MFKFGYNIDGQDVRDYLRGAPLINHIRRLQPTCTLVMDNHGLAQAIKNALPNCVVIDRSYSVHEGGEWQKRSPSDFVQQFRRDPDKRILRYLTNEASFNDGNFRDYCNHEAETVRLANRDGFGVVAFNVGIGRYNAERLQAGDMDNLIHAVMSSKNNYFGMHEYMTVSLPAAFKSPRDWLNKQAMQPNTWLTNDQFQRDYVNARYPGAWWLFRHLWVLQRAMDIGYNRAQLRNKFLLTEFGYDNIAFDGEVNQAVNDLRNRYGMAKFNNDMRGVETHERLYRDYYPDLSYHGHIIREFAWWHGLQHDWILGVCLFAINADWHEPEGHDYHSPSMLPLLPMLESLSARIRTQPDQPTQEEPPMANLPNDLTWQAATVAFRQATGFVNVRSIPGTTGADIGDITPSGVRVDVAYRGGAEYLPSGNGYDWLVIRYEDQAVGFVAREFVTVTPIASEPPTEPPIDPNTETLLAELEDTLKADYLERFAAVDATLANLDAMIDAKVQATIDAKLAPQTIDFSLIDRSVTTFGAIADLWEVQMESEIAMLQALLQDTKNRRTDE